MTQMAPTDLTAPTPQWPQRPKCSKSETRRQKLRLWPNVLVLKKLSTSTPKPKPKDRKLNNVVSAGGEARGVAPKMIY